MLTENITRQLLRKAIMSQILIFTSSSDEARDVKIGIVSNVKKMFGRCHKVSYDLDGVCVAGYQYIYIMSVKQYNEMKRFKIEPFKGMVFITNKGLYNDIKDFDTIYYLPLGGGQVDGTGIQSAPSDKPFTTF